MSCRLQEFYPPFINFAILYVSQPGSLKIILRIMPCAEYSFPRHHLFNFHGNSQKTIVWEISYQHQQRALICGFELSIFQHFIFIWNFNPLLSRAALLLTIYCEWDKTFLLHCATDAMSASDFYLKCAWRRMITLTLKTTTRKKRAGD